MKEYIERAALKRELAPYEENDFSQQMDVILAIVDAQPTADVVEVRHGRWIFDHMTGDRAYYANCSECGLKKHFKDEEAEQKKKYCSFCGARMDKEDEHEAGSGKEKAAELLSLRQREYAQEQLHGRHAYVL